MKFMTMVSSAETNGPPPPALMAAIFQLGEEAAKKGVLVQQGGLHRSERGARVRIRKGKLIVTDGPFSESKEIVGGFAVYGVASKEECIEWTKRFMELHREHWPGWEGEAELRQIYEPGEPPEC